MPTTRPSLLTAEAVLLIVLGLAALVLPVVAGLAVSLVIGVVLVLSGAIGLAATFRSGRRHHLGWSALSAAVALLAGVLILVFPVVATVGLTLILGAYLLVDGIALIGLGLNHRTRASGRWGWLLASGVFDLLLSALVLTLSVAGAAVLVGVVVGIDLIAAGAALLLLRHATEAVAAAPTPI